MKIQINKNGHLSFTKDNGDILKSKFTYDDNLDLSRKGITKILNFPDIVKGSVNLSHNQLEKLDHFASKIYGSINLSNNKLTTLENLPINISSRLDISKNKLNSLEFLPRIIGGDLDYTKNNIKVLPSDKIEIYGSLWTDKFIEDMSECVGENIVENNKYLNINNSRFGFLIGKKPEELVISSIIRNKDRLFFNNNNEITYNDYKIYEFTEIVRDIPYYVTIINNELKCYDNLDNLKDRVYVECLKEDLNQLKGLDVDEQMSTHTVSIYYRAVTGACGSGTYEFVKKLPNDMTLREFYKITSNEESGDLEDLTRPNKFKDFFNIE